MSVGTRVAVVLTCYDSGTTLVQAVDSIRPEPVELVVVDDGSTDASTLEILGRLEGEGVRVVHQANQGLSGALMTGVAATTSPYVFRFDADDLLEPGAADALADALDANPESAAAWGDLQTFGLTNVRVPSVPALDPWHLTHASMLPASSLFRRSALLEVGGWQLRGGYEDWDVWLALAERGHGGTYVPRVVYRYRREREGLLHDSLGRFDDHYRELQRRHAGLFRERALHRSRSPAPRALKALLPLVDRLPISRLRKVWATQLLTHLFWNGGVRATGRVVAQGASSRLRFLGRRSR